MSVSLVENTSRFDLEILTISLNRLVFSDTELLSYVLRWGCCTGEKAPTTPEAMTGRVNFAGGNLAQEVCPRSTSIDTIGLYFLRDEW